MPVDPGVAVERRPRRVHRSRQVADFRDQAGHRSPDRSRQAELDDVAVVGVDVGVPGSGHRPREPVVRQVVREHAVDAGGAPGVGHRRLERLLGDPRAQRRGAVRRRPRRRDQHQIAVVGLPRLDLRKHLGQRRVDGAQRARVDLVALHPLREDAVVGEALARGAVELGREQAGDAGAERVRRLRGDDVEAIARGQQRLARVGDGDVDARVAQHAVVDRLAGARHLEHQRLELDDVDALHRGHGAEPAGAAAGAEADDQRALRLRMAEGAEQAEHDLRPGIAARAAVRLAVDDEGVAVLLDGERDGALDAVAVPDDGAAAELLPAAQLVRRIEDVLRRPAGADAAVPPDHRRARGGEEQERDRGQQRQRQGTQRPQRSQGRVVVAGFARFAFQGIERRRGDAERDQHDGDEPPRAGRRQPRHHPEPAGEGADDRTGGVRRVGEADVAPEPIAAAAEQRDQQRELVASDNRRRQNDDRRHQRPAGDGRAEAGGAERQ